MPELIFPALGLAVLLPELVRPGSNLFLAWRCHDGSPAAPPPALGGRPANSILSARTGSDEPLNAGRKNPPGVGHASGRRDHPTSPYAAEPFAFETLRPSHPAPSLRLLGKLDFR